MSSKDWDPTVLACEGQVDNESWFDVQSSFLDCPNDKSFDEVGNCRFRSYDYQLFFFDSESFKDHDLDDVIQKIH